MYTFSPCCDWEWVWWPCKDGCWYTVVSWVCLGKETSYHREWKQWWGGPFSWPCTSSQRYLPQQTTKTCKVRHSKMWGLKSNLSQVVSEIGWRKVSCLRLENIPERQKWMWQISDNDQQSLSFMVLLPWWGKDVCICWYMCFNTIDLPFFSACISVTLIRQYYGKSFQKLEIFERLLDLLNVPVLRMCSFSGEILNVSLLVNALKSTHHFT